MDSYPRLPKRSKQTTLSGFSFSERSPSSKNVDGVTTVCGDQPEPAIPSELPTTSASSKMPLYAKWIALPKYYCHQTGQPVFVLSANSGILCSLCTKHSCHGDRGHEKFKYSRDAAFPARAAGLEEHIESERHKNAVSRELVQRTSVFEKMFQERVQHKQTTVAERIHMIYWMVKEEMANRKLTSLQNLINKVGNNERLRDFGHCSSTLVSEMILLIAESFTEKTIQNIRASPFWSTMVDESTDVAMFQQFITFVRFVSDGVPTTRFLDIRSMDSNGATAENLFATFRGVIDDYELDLDKHVAIACDGAAAMIGRNNSLSQRLLDTIPTMTVIHCYAHRLALACCDTVKDLSVLQKFERTLLQVWKFFAVSPLKSAHLAKNQKQMKTSGKRLQRMCKTRWLSSNMAVAAMMSEITAVWSTLEYFANERNDAVAIGTLHLCRNKMFVQILHLLSAVLPHLTTLSIVFQGGNLNFAQVSPSVALCNDAIKRIREDQVVLTNLEGDWHRFESELGKLNEQDCENTKRMTVRYCNALLDNLKDRFPEPEVISSFSVFDPSYCPDERKDRDNYGVQEIQILIDRFGDLLDDPGRMKINWPAFVERLTMVPLKKCKGAAQVCSVLCKDPFFEDAFPDIRKLATIALVVPLSTCWPERGFSTMLRVKSKSRNRLLDETLCALMNISINGPEELSNEDAQEIALKWLQQKKRRSVTQRGASNLREIERRVASQKERKRKRQLGQSCEPEEPVEDISDDDMTHGGFEETETLSLDEIEMDTFYL